MTRYIDINDLVKLVPEYIIQQLTDDDCTGEVITSTTDEIIAEACEMVDGYLRGRYSLPFAKTPTMVKGLTKSLARYMFYDRRPEGDIPTAVIRGYESTHKTLAMIRDGKLSIGVPETGAIQNDDGEFHVRVRPSKDKQSRFRRDVLDKW